MLNQNGSFAGDMASHAVVHGGVEEGVDRIKLRRPSYLAQAVDPKPQMTQAQ